MVSTQPFVETKAKEAQLNPILIVVVAGLLLAIAAAPGAYKTLLFGVFAFVFLWLAARQFDRMWILFVAVLPFVSLITPLFGQWKITGNRTLLLAMTGLFLLKKGLDSSRWPLPRRLAFYAFLLFVLANVLSALFAQDVESVFRAFTYLEPLLYCALTYSVLSRDSRHLKGLLQAVVIGAALVVGLAFCELWTQRPILDTLGIETHEATLQYMSLDRFGLGGRVVSIFGQPVYAGIYFGLVLVLSIAYAVLYARSPWRLVLLFVPAGLLAVFATGSRGPILALVPTAAAFIFFGRMPKRAAVGLMLLLALVVLLLFVMLPDLPSYFSASLDVNQYSAASANLIGRLDLTDAMVDIFRQSPLIGNGPGLIQKGGQQGLWMYQGLAGLENQYATILADGGLLAGATYVLFMVTVFYLLMQMSRDEAPVASRLAIAVMLSFIFYFTVVVSVTCLNASAYMLLMAMLGAAIGVHEASLSSQGPESAVVADFSVFSALR